MTPTAAPSHCGRELCGAQGSSRVITCICPCERCMPLRHAQLAALIWLKPADRPRRVSERLPITSIISGGQTGADIGGLRAARRLGLSTGGWAPQGWATLDGPAPQLGVDFGLVEHPGDYAARTHANVRDSDATIRFAHNFNSNGERCTQRAIDRYHKLSLSIHCDPEPDIDDVLVSFIVEHRVRVLNVAGNSEQTAPGIGKTVETYLERALRSAE